MPRNRELMRVFRDMELVEHLGSGMRRILNAYDSSIVHISEHFFELRFPMSSEALALIPEVAESGAESGVESGAESLSKKILHLLRDAALSKSELSSQLGLKSVTGALNRAVNALLEAHWIERTLPDKPQSRLQKYRLTQAGRLGMDASGKQDVVDGGDF
jgi:ATP-dependent DNA helicase RecG